MNRLRRLVVLQVLGAASVIGCAGDGGLQFESIDLSVPPPDATTPPPDLRPLIVPDFSTVGPDLRGDLSSCPPMTRPCGVSCVPDGFCCTDADCPAAGQRCTVNGSCQCPLDQKVCGASCIPLQACCTNADCPGNLCVRQQCVVPTCADGITDGNETDLDCGGGFCGRCLDSWACKLPGDCRSNLCSMGRCVPPPFIRSDWGGGTGPRLLRAADVDNDGKMDLVTLNGTSWNGSVLLGRGDGSFRTLESFTTDLNPAHFELADFDRDGRLDVVVANSSSNDLSVLLGNGDGTFRPELRLHAGAQPIWVAVGDPDQDGRKDIAVANNFSNTVGVLRGIGDGTFQAQLETPTFATRPKALVLRDFDGDTVDDLAVQCGGTVPPWVMGYSTGVLAIHPSRKAAVFGPPTPYATPTVLFTSLTTADLDGDGHPDLLLGSASQVAPAVFRGDGKGKLVYSGLLPAAIYAPFPVLTDLDGDKIPDLASSSGTEHGNGNGSFLQNVAWPGAGPGVPAVALADFNSDGKLDLAFPTVNDNSVTVLFGNGDGTFQPLNLPGSGSRSGTALLGVTNAALADLNGDGRDDLLVVGGQVGIGVQPLLWVRLANANGTLQAPSSYPLPLNAVISSIAVADLDGDKMPEVVVANSVDEYLYRWRGGKNGVLTPEPSLPLPRGAAGVALGDTDLDGKVDMALSLQGGTLDLRRGLGDRTFGAPVSISDFGFTSRPILRDVNGDRYLDVLSISAPAVTLVSSMGLDGNGVLQWSPAVPQKTPGAASISGGDIGDLDGDGQLDLVITDLNLPGIRLYPAFFSQKPGAPSSVVTPATPWWTRVVDLDGDKHLDVVTVDTADRAVTVLLGDGVGGFPHLARQDVGVNPWYVHLGDVNGDGKPDLVTNNYSADTVTLLLGGHWR